MAEDEREKLIRIYEEKGGKEITTYDDLSFLPRDIALAVYALHTGRPFFNPQDAPSQTAFPDALLEKHSVYPLFIGKKRVYLLSQRQSNYAFEDEWLSVSPENHVEMVSVLADRAAIQSAIERNRGRGANSSERTIQTGELLYSDASQIVEIDPLEMSHINPDNPNNSAEQVVQWVIHRALTLRASDLHVEKFYNMARFRARIDGQLRVIHSCSEEDLPRFIAMIKNYSGMGQQRQDTQDARFALAIGKRRFDVRLSAVPCRREQQKLTMRFLDKQGGIRKLTELHLSQNQIDIFNSIMSRDQGMVLVTGPTGSGKTTTLYALLNHVNDEKVNIHTIEDPIEYELEGINQTQTDPFHGITFATGLRALLRADPDVMLIGESRDSETAMAAVTSALTGHLVLTTLHANDSLRAVSRLISMNVPPYLVADALALTQAQRLVRKLCNYCKRPHPVTSEVIDYFRSHGVLGDEDEIPKAIYEAVGCDECAATGYFGRLALMELCLVTPELADMISREAPQNEMRRVARRHGFKSLYQEGLVQVLTGNTTFEEIRKVAYTAA
ncbi:MAG: GspE/PulE family protein [Verrucomicrobiales bacterium]